MEELNSIYGIATAIAVVTLALTEIVKTTEKVPVKYMPFVSLVIGMLLGWAAAPIHTATIAQLLWGGGISGLMASGVFSSAKKILQGESTDEESTNSRK